jgi:hypothetical protein
VSYPPQQPQWQQQAPAEPSPPNAQAQPFHAQTYQAPAFYPQAPFAGTPTTPGQVATRPITAWVMLAAGVAAVLGSFLPWATISAPIVGTVTVSGVDGSDGWITAALGVVLAVYAGLRLRGQRLPVVAPSLAAISALVLIAIAIWKIVDVKSMESDMKASMSGQDDPLGIGAAFSSAVHVSIGSGLWLITAAGLAGAIALTLTLITRNRTAGR